MKDDPIVAEVRRVRDALARKFKYSIHAIFEDLRQREGKTVTGEKLRSGTGHGTPYPPASGRASRVREKKPEK
jgi:hypothetical protein